MIQVQDVRVAIDGVEILHGVSFEIAAGSVAGYVGPNGAGKSTLLLQLTGAVSGQGAILLDGETAQVSVLREYVGLVFQNPDVGGEIFMS